MLKLVLATQNSHKVAELRSLLGDVEVLPRPEGLGDIDETGDSFEANARLKADGVCRVVQAPSLADDSGLEVTALGGEPGVMSARYSGYNASDASNTALLLDRMQGRMDREAHFVCVVALARPGLSTECFSGTLEGFIADSARGSNGFGYDSVFIPLRGDGRTLAEMSPWEKNAISHRSRALDRLRLYLKEARLI